MESLQRQVGMLKATQSTKSAVAEGLGGRVVMFGKGLGRARRDYFGCLEMSRGCGRSRGRGRGCVERQPSWIFELDVTRVACLVSGMQSPKHETRQASSARRIHS